ncbi:MAG: 16S rRNA (adenine(1518)-N(6)/adenine(1519)-N(6))-dimethyltransferase RsmA [Candidatus Methylacidiphilaceae bacterium]
MNIREIQQALAREGLRPLQQLGQNFLHDKNLAIWIVDCVLRDLSPPWRVWEVGPGLGVLTGLLLGRGVEEVQAIEIDRGLAAILRRRFAGERRFRLIEGDVLRFEWPEPPAGWLAIGNLPYSISGPFLAALFRGRTPFRRIVLTLQREVAERLVARPRQPAYGRLSVMGQSAFRVEIRKRLPPSVFYPAPKVNSAVVCLEPLGAPPVPWDDREAFCAFVRRAFLHRRKCLGKRLGCKERRRPEELSIGEWVGLWQELRDRSLATGSV